MASPDVSTDPSTLHLLISKLLDWPFLLFVTVMLLAGKTLLELIGTRKLDIEIAGNKLSIGDAIEFLEEDTTRDLAELAARIDIIESRMKSRSSDEPDGDTPGGALTRMLRRTISATKAKTRSSGECSQLCQTVSLLGVPLKGSPFWLV